MSLSDSITSLRTMLDTCESEVKSLETNSRKASSARARKSLQNIKTSCHGLRKDITEYTKALPTKARTKKEIISPTHAAVEAEIEPEIEAAEPVAVKPKKVRKTKVKAHTSI
jgi:hypothetical protein